MKKIVYLTLSLFLISGCGQDKELLRQELESNGGKITIDQEAKKADKIIQKGLLEGCVEIQDVNMRNNCRYQIISKDAKAKNDTGICAQLEKGLKKDCEESVNL